MGAKAFGLKDLEDDLQDAVRRAVADTAKVVGKGCHNIKKDAQRIIRAASHRGYLPHYPRSISYDVTTRGLEVSGEVGPKKEKLQGGLGPYLENGTVHNAPIPHMVPAIDVEEPRFYKAMEDLGVKLLEGEPVTGPVQDVE